MVLSTYLPLPISYLGLIAAVGILLQAYLDFSFFELDRDASKSLALPPSETGTRRARARRAPLRGVRSAYWLEERGSEGRYSKITIYLIFELEGDFCFVSCWSFQGPTHLVLESADRSDISKEEEQARTLDRPQSRYLFICLLQT